MAADVAVITCPECGTSSQAVLPRDACLHFYVCPGCDVLLSPKAGDCCVFCSYGDRRCPPKLAELGYGAGSL